MLREVDDIELVNKSVEPSVDEVADGSVESFSNASVRSGEEAT